MSCKLLLRPFGKLNKTEKRVAACCYIFSAVTFALFSWSFNPVLLVFSILSLFAGTMVRTEREFLEAMVKQSYSPPITEEEVNDFSNAFDENTETTNENSSNNPNGGEPMNPILVAIGLIVSLGVILVALPVAPFFIGLVLVLALGLGFTGYNFGKKSKK